jgi:HAMP domain-containing protein
MRQGIRLYWLILSLLLPVVLAGTIIVSLSIQKQFASSILRSFDNKLTSIVSFIGVFLDGNAHKDLYPKRDLQHITYDTTGNRLLGLDRANYQVLEIHPDGSGEPLLQLPALPFAGFASATNRAYFLLERTPTLLEANLLSGDLTFHPASEAATLRGLFIDPDIEGLLGYGDGLFAWENSQKFSKVQTLTKWSELKNPVYINDQNGWIAMNQSTSAWIAVEGTTPRTRVPAFTMPVAFQGDLASDGTTLWAAGNSLGIVDTATGEVSFEPDIPNFFRGQNDYYHDQLTLFRHIRKITGLSYLYTLVFRNSSTIFYVLDGSEGEDYTAIGYTDALPEDNFIPLKTSELTLTPVVRPVEEWESWGLIKSGFGPVLLDSESAEGLIGADLKVDIIEARTKRANYASIATAVLGIVLALSTAIAAAKSLTRPIERLQRFVVGIAGGELSAVVPHFGIREFEATGEVFSLIKGDLQEAAETTANRTRQYQYQARETLLTEELSASLKSQHVLPEAELEISSLSNTSCIGFTKMDDWVIFSYFQNSQQDSGKQLASIRTARQWELVSNRMLPRGPEHWMRFFHSLNWETQTALFIVNEASGELHYQCSEDLLLKTSAAEKRLSGTGTILLDSGKSLIRTASLQSTQLPPTRLSHHIFLP